MKHKYTNSKYSKLSMAAGTRHCLADLKVSCKCVQPASLLEGVFPLSGTRLLEPLMSLSY